MSTTWPRKRNMTKMCRDSLLMSFPRSLLPLLLSTEPSDAADSIVPGGPHLIHRKCAEVSSSEQGGRFPTLKQESKTKQTLVP